MSQKVDELFGKGGSSVQPKTLSIIALLASGMLLAVLGLACSSVPGGLLVLWAWSIMEKEIDRVESGYLPEEAIGHLRSLKTIVWTSLLIVLILFIGQTVLLFTGFYIGFWGFIVEQFATGSPASP